MIRHSFPTFSERQGVFESVQAAKDYLLKKYAVSKNIKTSEIDEETKKKILSNSKFIKIRDLTAKYPGYTPMFLKFYMEQGAEMSQLQEILADLERFKQNLKQDLSMPITDYEKVVPDAEDHRPGYERLGDDLRNIERKRKLKKFYNEFTPVMKRMFAKATDDQIEQLTEISNQLERLKPKEGEDENGNRITLYAWKEFSKNFKKYEDTRTYPEYRDPKVAFSDIIKDSNDFIKAWDEDESALLKKLRELGPMNGILYAKNGYIVQSARTPESQLAVCADTSWCIRNPSTFWNYGGGRIQINIINSNIPVTNIRSLVGITVNADESIHTMHLRNNERYRASTLKEALNSLDYPKDLIEAVLSKFKMETDLKLALEQFYKEGDNLTVRKVLESLVSSSKGFLAGIMPQEDWERISGLVAQIIEREFRGIRKSDFLQIFRELGIFTEANLNVFDAIIGKDYTQKDMEDIIKTTTNSLQEMKFVLELCQSGDLSLPTKSLESIKIAMKEEKKILEKLKAKL